MLDNGYMFLKYVPAQGLGELAAGNDSRNEPQSKVLLRTTLRYLALEEIPINRAAMAQSERVILVADRSKFGKPSLISMIPLANVHTLVPDATPPEDAAAVFRNLHMEVITPQD